jgi:taurine dioxygenase
MITVKKLTATIGAEIGGVDLSQPLSADTVAAIQQAYNDNLVIFFRDQKPLDDETHIRVGKYFGTLDISEIQPTPREHREILVLDQVAPKGEGADRWHRDRTYLEVPPQGSILQCVQRAEVGGDTCWASMYAAYEALSEPMQKFIDGLTARHWTEEVIGLTHTESEALLNFLFDHTKNPEFQVRYNWQVNDVAFWDNRCSVHYAVADYTSRRIMKRVALVGHKPVGPNG